MLHEFGNYLRLSFDFANAAPLVPLEHELSLVRSYLYIEQERFGDRIRVVWDLDIDCDFWIPPLSIQPLVENAVKHGLMSRKRGGTVTISIRKEEDHALIRVEDDGTGMRKEQLDQLLNARQNPEAQGRVGLRNIARRLKRQFRTGLDIRSEPNRGTSVSFRIPLQTGPMW